MQKLQKFLRKAFIKEASGFTSNSSLHDAMNDGRFPRPDGYIGSSSPVWLEESFERWQQEVLAQQQEVSAQPTPDDRVFADQDPELARVPDLHRPVRNVEPAVRRRPGRPRKSPAALAGGATTTSA